MSLPINSPSVEASAGAIRKEERRHFPRYTVRVPIEIHEEGSNIRRRVETTDLSRGGCYVELMMPLPVGIRVQATLWLNGSVVVIQGRVATRHPQYGNGIMFIDFEGQGQGEVVLNRYLDAVVALG
ncbi:MAG: PilZ domain-containing protein [Terriglobales bacterium]|jgi:hypothetical protein